MSDSENNYDEEEDDQQQQQQQSEEEEAAAAPKKRGPGRPRSTKAKPAKAEAPAKGKRKAREADEEDQKRSRKKQKDPNAPKRNLTAYFLWTMDRRPLLRADDPDLKVTEIAKRLGAEWREIDESIKKKYEKLAVKDKERYQRQLAQYNETGEFDA